MRGHHAKISRGAKEHSKGLSRSGRSAGKSVLTFKGIVCRRLNKITKIDCVVCFIQKSRIILEQTSDKAGSMTK